MRETLSPAVQDGGSTPSAAAPVATLARIGFLWLLAQSVAGRVVVLASQILLAWFLSPADFGMVSIVYGLTTVCSALVNFGIDDVLVQREKAIRSWIFPAFSLTLILGLAGFLAAAAAALASARIYGAQTCYLTLIAAIAIPVTALQTVPLAMQKGAMNFRLLATLNFSELLTVQIGSIALAAAGAGPYSFVLPIPVAATGKLIALWYLSQTRLSVRYRWVQFLFFAKSGAYVFLTKAIISLVSQGDYLILGLTSTKAQAGYYFFAYRLAALPIFMLAGNLISVLYPSLVKLRAEPERQLAAALKAGRTLSYIVMPICVAQALLAAPIIALVFGPKWSAAAPLIALLSLGLALDAVTWVTGSLLSANREYKTALLLTVLFAPLFFLLVAVGAAWAHEIGVAFAVFCYYCIMGPAMTWLTLRRYRASPRVLYGLLLRPAVVSFLALGLPAAVAFNFSNLAKVLFVGAVSPFLFAALVAWLDRDLGADLLRRFGGQRVLNRMTPVRALLRKIM